MNLQLVRRYAADETTGTLTGAGLALFSIEQPWRGNAQGASCVPEGVYALVPYNSPTHGPTWYLLNAALGVGGAGAARSFCEFHAANWARQLEGCVAFGLSASPLYDPETGIVEAAVEESRDAIVALINALGSMTEGHTLTISSQNGVPQ